MSTHVPEARVLTRIEHGSFGSSHLIPETPTNYAVQLGLKELDAVISRRHPYLITVIAPTGSGKTAYAVQATSEAASKGKKVLFVSTETTFDEFTYRYLSVSTRTPYEKIKEGIYREKNVTPMVPSLAEYGPKGASDLLAALRHLKGNVEFLFLSSYNRNLPEVQGPLIDKSFDLCIFDWLGISEIGQTVNDLSETEKTLKWLSESTSTTTILTAQSKICEDDGYKGEFPDWTPSECTKLGASSDLTISISNYYKDEEQLRNDDSDDPVLREQHLHIHEIKQSIPFIRAFEIQRFEDTGFDSAVDIKSEVPDEALLDTAADEDEFLEELCLPIEQQALRIKENIRRRHGYVKLERRVVQELIEIENPSALNVYIFLLLVAKHQDCRQLKIGDSICNRETISKHTGLSVSKCRTALKYLKAAEMVSTRKKERGRGLIYRVKNYPGSKTKGYFKLYRNILEKPELFGNPETLRVWIYFLSQVSNDVTGLEPGQILVYGEDVADVLQLSLGQYLSCLEELKRSCRIGVYPEEDDGARCIEINKWEVYRGNYIYNKEKAESHGG